MLLLFLNHNMLQLVLLFIRCMSEKRTAGIIIIVFVCFCRRMLKEKT